MTHQAGRHAGRRSGHRSGPDRDPALCGDAARLRRAALAYLTLALAALGGCTAPPPRPVPLPVPAQPVAPQVSAPVLLPGCVLPLPELLAQAATPRAVLAVQVDAGGQVTAAKVRAGTGSADLDVALQSALQACRFQPASALDLATLQRIDVASDRMLEVRWTVPPVPYGPHRCLTPDYPRLALRREEAGRVRVQFRKDAATGAIETHLRQAAPGAGSLVALSLRAVSICLQHETARAQLPPDTWFAIDYDWRLE
jgi:TonB family protein